jgi:hypothetical protein
MGVGWMDKQTLSSIIVEQLNQMGIENTHGNGTDISIVKEFVDTNCERINYEAYMFLDETIQTVSLFEKTTVVGKDASIGEQSENSFQLGTTLFGKAESVQYNADGKASGYELNLESITKTVMNSVIQNGWSFKTVITKDQALYPAGYLPPFIPPVYNPPIKHEKKQEQKIAGFCENCGGAINLGVQFCSKCGAPVPITFLNGVASPTPISTTTSTSTATSMGSTKSFLNKTQQQGSQHQQQQPQYQEAQHQRTPYGNPQNGFQGKTPSMKSSKAGVYGFIGFIIVGLFMLLLLLVDKSPLISWAVVSGVFVIAFFIQRKIKGRGFVVNLVLLIVSALVLFVSFGLTSTQISLDNADINNGHMTTAIDPSGKPSDEVSSYKINTKQLVAVGELQNAPQSTHIKFVWTYVTGKIKLAEYSMDSGDKGANIYVFGYLTNHGAWSKGEYKVELYIEDRTTADEVINFTIK